MNSPRGEEYNHSATMRSRDGFFYADNAVLVGDLSIAPEVNIWYGTILRGDDAPITIGRGTNLQDLTMVHADPGKPLDIEEFVTIGHRAIVHCVEVGAHSLIGMGAILMEDVVVGSESLIAAGAVVSPGTVIPPRSLVRGVPGRVVRETSEAERASILRASKKYIENAKEFFSRYGG